MIAVKVLINAQAKSSGSPHKVAAGVFGWPAGTWLVGIAGAIMIGVGLYQGYRGLSKDFLHDSKTEEMSPAVRTWITRLGVFGYLARMVVFVLVGVFLIKAALRFRRESRDRPRRRARQDRPRLVWALAARRRRLRPDRLRALLGQRRSLSADLDGRLGSDP